jgi:hypothetical protein
MVYSRFSDFKTGLSNNPEIPLLSSLQQKYKHSLNSATETPVTFIGVGLVQILLVRTMKVVFKVCQINCNIVSHCLLERQRRGQQQKI